MAYKLSKKALISAFFIAILFTCPAATASVCPNLSKYSTARGESDYVQWVVDGDTIHTRNGSKLRLLHINAPEINPKSQKPAEYYAIKSRDSLAQLAPKNSKISWYYDQKTKDKYGRKLALVFNTNGSLINLEQVSRGAASTLVVPPNQSLWHCFVKAQANAEKNRLGIWKFQSKFVKSVDKLKSEKGFLWLTGKVTQIKETKKYRWVILDDKLWVGIKRNDFQYFSAAELKFNKGSAIKVGGYLYHSYGKLRLNLRHPAMFSRN